MSLNRKGELVELAKVICRDLRKNSTKSEQRFWEAVRDKRFLGKKFYRQYPIFHDITGKETFFIVDFFCFEDKLAIELDGIIHKYRITIDTERTEILNKLGVNVLRFTNDEIENNLEESLKKIEEYFVKKR